MKYIIVDSDHYKKIKLTNDIRDWRAVEYYKNIIAEDNGCLPLPIFLYNRGSYYIADGTHRCLALALKNNSIAALVINSSSKSDVNTLIAAETARYVNISPVIRGFILGDFDLREFVKRAIEANQNDMEGKNLQDLVEWVRKREEPI